MFKKIKKIIEDNDAKLVILLAIVFSISAIIFFYQRDELLLYNDARSHLNIARRVIDDLTPGVAQFGGAWLPLYQILELPFVFFNILWQTGLAGSIVSSVGYVGSVLFIYLLVRDITNKKFLGLCSILIFSLNPNMLYTQSIPLTEVWLIFGSIGSIYFFYKWLLNSKLSNLLISSLFVFLATGVRYDAWFLAVIEVLMIIVWSIKLKLQAKTKQSFFMFEGEIILFGYIAFFGIFLWLLWNFLIWGNPLYFILGEHSARIINEGYIRFAHTQHNLLQSLSTFSWASADILGYVVFLLAILSFIILIIKKRISPEIIVLFLFFSIFLFNVLSLFLGISVIYVPQLEPLLPIFNIRYGITTLPFAAIAPAILFKKKILWLIILPTILLNFIWMIKTNNVLVYEDGLRGISSSTLKYDLAAAKWFRNNYDDGLILWSAFSNDPIGQEIGLPFKLYIHEGSYHYWDKALKDPSKFVKWIIFRRNDLIGQNLLGTSKLNNYIKVYDMDGQLIYRIKDNESINKFKDLKFKLSLESWIKNNNVNGNILINNFRIPFNNENVSLSRDKIIDERKGNYWENSLKEPNKYVDWIILQKNDKDKVWMSLKDNFLFNTYFQASYNVGENWVYKKRKFTDYLSREGNNLVIKGENIHLKGVNIYDLLVFDRSEIDSTFNYLSDKKINLVRIWGFGKNGLLSSTDLSKMDYVLMSAKAKNILVDIVFGNQYDDYGGREPFLYEKNPNSFYTNKKSISAFENQIIKIINRKNNLTNVVYKDDPTIAFWELLNEPRIEHSTSDSVRAWVETVGTFVSKNDSNHLISVGTEGFMGGNGKDAYHEDHGSNIDAICSLDVIGLCSVHLYPKYITKGLNQENVSKLISDWKSIADKYNKPLYIGEVGFDLNSVKNKGDQLDERQKFFNILLMAVNNKNISGIFLWNLAIKHDQFYSLSSTNEADNKIIEDISKFN